MKRGIEHYIGSAVIAAGVASVATQLVIIRELLTRFQGNEFIIALIFFVWLVLGGIGTWAAHITGPRFLAPSRNRLAIFSLILVCLSVCMLIAIRELPNIFFIFGSTVGFYPTLAFIAGTTAPYCLLLGFLVPYSLFSARSSSPGYPGTKIYVFDNIGDVAGGVLFSFVLIYLTTPFQALFIANLPLLIAGFLLFTKEQRFRIPAVMLLGASGALLVAGILIEPHTLGPANGKRVHYEESRYGRIEVLQANEQYTLFADGVPIAGTQNPALAESTIHYPLSQLDHTNKILLISAEGGMMKEAAKYRPERIDYVEIDPSVSHAAFQYGIVSRIDGLNVINKDGRAYLAETDLPLYNAIICTLPDPDTFQINRFYTDRFFQLARSRLTSDGIISFSVAGFDNYMNSSQRTKLSILYRTARAYFRHVLMLPGERIIFVCRNAPLSTDIPALLAKKNIRTRYIRGYFYGDVTPDRIAYLRSQIDPAAGLNTDFSPRIIRAMFSAWFSKYANSPFAFALLLILLLCGYLAVSTREEFVLFTTGWILMGTEILVIFAFQIFFGYVYSEIGLIITVFLAGLFPGAVMGEKLRRWGRHLFLLTDFFLIILIFAFIAATLLIGDRLPAGTFLVFGFLVSLACGVQFPVALYLRGDNRQAAVRVFSADLIGAGVGILAISAVMIPFMGIIWASVCLIGIKGLSLVMVARFYE